MYQSCPPDGAQPGPKSRCQWQGDIASAGTAPPERTCPDRKRTLLGQPNALDPCGIDNIDRESSQAWSPDIVPVRFDVCGIGARKSGEVVRFDMMRTPLRKGLVFTSGLSV